MVQINYVIGYCLVFLSLAFLSLANEENIHDPSMDARHILFGRPIMSIPASALPPGYLPVNQHLGQQPCHSMDAQYPGQPCSPSLYSTQEPAAEQNPATIPPFLLNLFGHMGNKFVMTPDFHRYPFAINNQFRQDSQFPTIPEEDVPSQYA